MRKGDSRKMQYVRKANKKCKRKEQKMMKQEQLSLIDMNNTAPTNNAEKVVEKSVENSLKMEEATEVMKAVAARTQASEEMLKKTFSKKEIDEIIARRDGGSSLEKEETIAIRTRYRRIKKLVKEMEYGNNQKIIVFPSLTSSGEWYKLIEFSALYYVYRLAARMGRTAKIYNDSDKCSKAVFSASFQGIESFMEQMMRLEDPDVEITEDGIYIFTLKKAVSDEELTALRHMEQARREKMYNIMKPKKMDPAIFQQILLISRQVVPRARKLKKEYYNTTGEEMVRDVQNLLALYFDYSEGMCKREEVLVRSARVLNRMMAGVTVLSENKIWEYDIAVVIGTGLADLKRMIEKGLKAKNG